MKVELQIALECLWFGFEVLTRRDMARYFVAGGNTRSERQLEYLIALLRRQKLLEQRGRGAEARFTITTAGQERRRVVSPAETWAKPWDSQWRVFVFDLPSNREADRAKLWRALRAAKFGLLQRSVWVWPHETEQILRATIESKHLPECFCGFNVRNLFLCDDAELVATAWDWETITQGHDSYLQHAVVQPAALTKADDLGTVYRLARSERGAYQYAFALDPLLPRSLWPKNYKGEQVEQHHRAFVERLRTRLAALAAH
jgi:DNA-binding transcriptional regulator PaaX